MDQSPKTPYRRRSSAVDTSASPHSNGHGLQINSSHKPGALSHSRTTSSSSITSPTAPRPLSFSGVDGFGVANGSGNLSNGLYNLADELAGMGEECEGDGAGQLSAYSNGEESLQQGHWRNVAISMGSHTRSSLRLSPSDKRHSRETSKYDGSDVGEDSDLDEASWISPSLAAGIAAVETLALRGTVRIGSNADKIAERVADSLKDLTPQSNLEQYATRYAFFSLSNYPSSLISICQWTSPHRLVTTQNALTTHISHQTRLLQTLSHPLFSPLSTHSPDISFIDDLLALLSSLEPLLPALNPQTISMLHLHSSTTDLLFTLSALCDSIHVIRQTTSLAARRLRAAIDIVADLRKDAAAREESISWVEKGRWGDRLAGRDCARVCGEVVDGFEDVCNGWRNRLLAEGGICGRVEVEICAG